MSQEITVPPHSPTVVELILSCIASSGYRTVHYTGAADEGLLRSLISHQPKLEVSVMDMPDRWGTGYAFWHDEHQFPNCLPRERPDWLECIPFYQEGAADHEIAIRDWPWDFSDQLDRIVRFTGRKAPSMLIILGLADLCKVGYEGTDENGEWERGSMLRAAPFRHPSYLWEQHGEVWLGKWIPDQSPLVPLPDDDYDEEE